MRNSRPEGSHIAFEQVRPIFGLEDLPRGSPVDPVSVERIMQEHPGLLTRFISMLSTVRNDPAPSTPYAVAMRLSQSFIRGAYGNDPTWTELDLKPVPWSKELSEEEHAERRKIFRRSEEFVAAHILPIANLYTIWTAFHHPELVAIPGDPISAVQYQTNGNDVAETKLQAEKIERERRQIRVVPPAVERIVGRILVRRPDRRPEIQVTLEDIRAEDRRLEDSRPGKRGLTVQALVGTVRDIAVTSRRLSTQWKLVGACVLLILIAVHPTWIAVSDNRSAGIQAPQVPKRFDPAAEGGGPTQTSTPHVRLSLGSAETPSAETPSEKASPEPGTSRRKVAPLASSEKQQSSRQPASPTAPVRSNAGPQAKSSDPSDPAGVIDWLLKERSAINR